MAIQRVFASVFTDRLQESRDFWVGLLGFTVSFDSNWFVQLASPGDASLELGLLLRNHETVPEHWQHYPRGTLITVVGDDADAVHARALARGDRVVEEPKDMFYGMRRLLLADPNGQLIDVSSPLDRDPTEVDV